MSEELRPCGGHHEDLDCAMCNVENCETRIADLEQRLAATEAREAALRQAIGDVLATLTDPDVLEGEGYMEAIEIRLSYVLANPVPIADAYIALAKAAEELRQAVENYACCNHLGSCRCPRQYDEAVSVLCRRSKTLADLRATRGETK